MHSFRCSCGHKIEILPPTAQAGYLVLDTEIDAHIQERNDTIRGFLDAVGSGLRSKWLEEFFGPNVPQPRFTKKDDADVIEDILSNIGSGTRLFFNCPECKRIHIQTKSGAQRFKAYTEE